VRSEQTAVIDCRPEFVVANAAIQGWKSTSSNPLMLHIFRKTRFAHSGWKVPSTAYMRWMRTSSSIGIILGIALGVPIGLALDSIGMGIGIGLALTISAGWLLGDRA
jgi:hypothetical protein